MAFEFRALNRRLQSVEYLASVDEPAHAELGQMVADFGGTPVPSNHPYAWRRNYENYEELLRQHGNGTLRQTYAPYRDVQAEYIADWRDYHSKRDSLRYTAERRGLTADDVTAFLKLEPGDLTKKFEPGCDRKEWEKSYVRVFDAHQRYRPLTDEQFTIQFLCFVVKQMQTQLAAMSAKGV